MAHSPRGAEDGRPFAEAEIGGDHCPAGDAQQRREGPKTDVHSLKLRLVVIIARQAMRSNAERG